MSPVLFCIHIDSLLHALAESGVGCSIGRFFVVALVYADDIVLLSPTASCGVYCAYVTRLQVTSQSSSVLLNPNVYSLKLGATLLHIVIKPPVS